MKNIHLTDEMLQAHLLKEIQDDTITTHLTLCTKCIKRLEEYRFLIDRVQQIDPETFPFDVTNLIMNNIMLYEKKKSQKEDLVFWGLLILLFLAISALSIPFIPKILAILNSKSILTTLLLTGTALAVLLFLSFALIDQYKSKEDHIFKDNLQPLL